MVYLKPLIILTRESPLAMKQALWVEKRLCEHHPHLQIQLLGVKTSADQFLDTPLTDVGGKGLFIKELEEGLLADKGHIAVHSLKDMPMETPEGLALNVICERENPQDVFISNHYRHIEDMPPQSKVGTSSLRRQCQLRAFRDDLNYISVRGNVNTRISKLDQGEFDAIILAAAGIKRLGLDYRISSYLSLEKMLPAAGQGALAIECRFNDDRVQQLINPLNDFATHQTAIAERALCRHLGGGCQLPLAAYAHIENNKIHLKALVGTLDGQQIIRAGGVDEVDQAEHLGVDVAKQLLQQGAREILRRYS